MRSLALKILFGDRAKLFGLIAGVAFATVLITQQGGLFVGLMTRVQNVIADAGERGLRISTPRGPRHVTVVFVNEHTDIAIITADVDCPCAEIAQRQVETPAKVVAIGYPLGLPIPTFTFGHVQGVDADGMVYMTAPITGGTSGGGMFDDRGMLQGVLLATANDCFGWVQRDDVETVDPTTSVCTRVHWMSFASTLTDLKTAILVAAKRLGSDVLAKTIWDPTPQVNLGVRG